MEKYVEVKRMSAFDVSSSIIMETPVKKGVLRNNWFVQIGSPSNETTDDGDKSGQQAIARINAELMGTTIVQDIYLTNNLPYAHRIEYDGHSGQAPEGMVRVNLLRWDSIVARNARRVANGV